MFAKVALLALVATAAMADRPSFNSYQPPEVRSYEPPKQTYQQPESRYIEPERTYQEPERTYQEPEKTYEAPSRSAYEPQPSYSQNRPSYQSEENQEGMPFNYNWEVNDAYSGNTFNHGSESDGKVTTGEYRVLLPDGRTQIVKYTAGGYDGYQAEVTYEGEAKAYEPAPSRNNNRYEAPRQTYEEPKQTYEQPKQTYQQPKQTYQQPKNTYEQPKQTYQRPQQTYEQPRRTYEQPRG